MRGKGEIMMEANQKPIEVSGTVTEKQNPVEAITSQDFVDLQTDADYEGRAKPRYTITLEVEGARLKIVADKAHAAFGSDIKTVEKVECPTSRQGQFDEAIEEIESAKTDIEDLKDELEQWKDNIPENLKQGEKAQELEAAIENIESVINTLANAISESQMVEFPGM